MAGSFIPLDITTTDSYQYLDCPGARKLLLQISNAAVYIGFGHGIAGNPQYDSADEPYLPVVGSIVRDCDQIRVKSYAKGTPAQVKITPSS